MSTNINKAFKDIAKNRTDYGRGWIDEQLVLDYFMTAVNSLSINDNIKHQLERTNIKLNEGVLYIFQLKMRLNSRICVAAVINGNLVKWRNISASI